MREAAEEMTPKENSSPAAITASSTPRIASTLRTIQRVIRAVFEIPRVLTVVIARRARTASGFCHASPAA